jgi:cell wall-associated NlpC family hydrolase
MITSFKIFENESRNDLIKKSGVIKNSGEYMNCLSFIQKMTGISDIKKLPNIGKNIFLSKKGIKNIEFLQEGDILEFNNISHYSIYIGNNEVLEVEQWGDSPRIIPLIDVLKDYEGTTNIYRFY